MLLLVVLPPSKSLHQSMLSQLPNLSQSLLLPQLLPWCTPFLLLILMVMDCTTELTLTLLQLCLTVSQPSVSTVCPTMGSPLWLPLLPSKPSSCSYILQALPQLNTARCS